MKNNFLDLLQITTNTRINEKCVLHDDYIKNAVNKFPADTKFKNFDDIYSTTGMDNGLYQQGFLQVVTETVFHYPVTFFSEKTTKPILNKRPFVIVGPCGSLASLHSLGFKTFHNYWDEDYDNITDPGDRINAVVDIVEWVCNKSLFEIKNLCKSMEDVLNYNFNFYITEFKKQELKKFEKACIENLKSRYD